MKTFSAIFIVLSMSLFISCSDSVSSVYRTLEMEGGMSDDYEMTVASAPLTDMKNYSSISEESRIQIKGNISLEVRNISDAIEEIRASVNQHNARVTSSESGDSYNKYANISILVPKESFDELIEAVKNVGTNVTHENINSNDVTEEFVDIGAKLNVMNQTENRFLALLSETSSVEEIMSVEKELMRLRGEIDSLEGRMKYLSKTTDNSVLNVYMTEEVPITGSEWSFFDSVDNSVRDLVSFSKHIANFLISLAVFTPIIIGIGLLFFFGNKFGKRYLHHRRK
jgi:hypothetical protein